MTRARQTIMPPATVRAHERGAPRLVTVHGTAAVHVEVGEEPECRVLGAESTHVAWGQRPCSLR
jgi:hypothetical protein